MVLGAQSQDGSGWKGPYSPSCSTPCHGQGHPPLDRLLQNLTLTRLPQLEEHHCKGLGLLRANDPALCGPEGSAVLLWGSWGSWAGILPLSMQAGQGLGRHFWKHRS